MNDTSDTYIPGRKRAPQYLGRVLILGLGVSGRTSTVYMLDLLGSRVETLTVVSETEPGEDEQWVRDARHRGACVLYNHPVIEESYDLCIASPGISQFDDFYQSAAAASREIISEVEFAWRESADDSRWVAITGTNGKTTTTALCAHLLQSAGMNARAVGNIGDACIDAITHDAPDIYVAETSSFQLASTVYFAPDVAVILNITPDHLTWHKDHQNYVDAKFGILKNLSTLDDACAIFDATNFEVRKKIREIKSIPREERGYDYIPIGATEGLSCDMRTVCGSENAAFIDGHNVMHVAFRGRDVDLVNANDMKIIGIHNISDALAASAAALVLGADPAGIREGLTTFESLEHRIEYVGEVSHVACYNDSKATNVDATIAALSAFEPKRPIVLLGGRDKLTDLEPLVKACKQYASAVVCFGEARTRFIDAFGVSDTQAASAAGAALSDTDVIETPFVVLQAEHLRDAFEAALGIATDGDIILLSPACASFDEFSCFEERGDAFKDYVRQFAQQQSHGAPLC